VLHEGQRPPLDLEARHQVRVFGLYELQRHAAPNAAHLAPPPDLAHAALAELAAQV